MEHQQQYVGIDLHRRRSVIVRMTGEGEVLVDGLPAGPVHEPAVDENDVVDS